MVFRTARILRPRAYSGKGP